MNPISLLLAATLGAGEALPGWMAGAWCKDDERQRIEERWLAPTRNLMLGANQTVRDGRTVAFEFLRVERAEDGTVHFVAQPGGRPATRFAMTAAGAGHARFENPRHDFPQVIEYRLNGDTLTATVGAGERELRFTFLPCPGD